MTDPISKNAGKTEQQLAARKGCRSWLLYLGAAAAIQLGIRFFDSSPKSAYELCLEANAAGWSQDVCKP